MILRKTSKNLAEWPRVVCDYTTITMHEMARATDAGVHRKTIASFASELVQILKLSSVRYLVILASNIPVKCDINVCYTAVRPTLV